MGPPGPEGPPGTGGGTITVLTTQPSTSSVLPNQLVFFWIPNGPSVDFYYRAPTGQAYQGSFGTIGPVYP
jgi:hypothetical protein